jgi:hypothetical protein
MRLRQIVVLMVVSGTATLAGCGGNDESSSPETLVSPGLDGTYEMTVAEDDAAVTGGASPGRWTLTINAGDATFDGPGGRHIPLMPTEISETRMIVPADANCPNNDPAPGEGEYELESSGDSLTFTEVQDPCGDRAFTFTIHTWQRSAP